MLYEVITRLTRPATKRHQNHSRQYIGRMKIDNKISHFLTGPYIFFGFLFIPGLLHGLLNHQPVLAGISVAAMAYLFATYSGVEIDTEKKKFRGYNKQFGLLKTGRWRSLDEYIGVTLVPMRKA